MCEHERVEIDDAAEPKGSDGGKPARRRALKSMMTDRKYTRARNNAEQTCFLEINAAVLGPEVAQHGDAGLNLAGGLRQQLCKGSITLGGIKSAPP